MTADSLASLERSVRRLIHDCRNKLNPLSGFAKLALQEAQSPQGNLQTVAEMLENSIAAADELTELLERLGQSVRMDPPTGTLNLEDLVQDTLEALPAISKGASTNVQIKTQVQSVPQAIGCAKLIGPALDQVIQNAIEALEDAPNPRMDVVLAPTASGVELQIIDNGPGLTPEEMEMATEPLYTTRRRGYQRAHGLGLTQAVFAVRACGGTLNLSPNTPQGLVVSMHFLAAPSP